MGSERRMFHELMGDLEAVPVEALQTALWELTSGTFALGALDEWHDWYHYLLPRLLPRAHQAFARSLLEILISGFISQYPSGITQEPYPGFQDDCILTLGRCMMDEQCWNGEEVRLGSMLHRSNRNPAQIWGWWNTSGDLSASLMFCIKYLPPELVAPWIRSALEIKSPHWRAQMMVWLVGAHDVLTGKASWPGGHPTGMYPPPSIDWDGMECLRWDGAGMSGETAHSDTPLPEGSRSAVNRPGFCGGSIL
jgi:hypothetical protein